MRKFVWLALLSIPVVVALTLPVSVLLPLFDPPDPLDRVRGTVWSGHAQWRQAGHVPLALSWNWDGGRRWVWRAEDDRTHLGGVWRPGAGTELESITGVLDLARVDIEHWLFATRPVGHLVLDIDRARLRSGDVPMLDGRVVWEEAGLEGSVHERLGRIAIELEPGPDRQRASVRSLEAAPVQVRGSIEADGETYWIDLYLRAARNRPDLARQIGTLGERQADGQVRLRVQGALGW